MTTTTTSPAPVRRARVDAVLLVVAAVALLLASLAASDRAVPGWDRAVFRAVNDRSVLPFAAVWPLMQLGNVLVVPLSALVAAATRRVRLAVGLLAGGFTAYLLAKLVKAVVERPRPAELLDDVVVRGPHVGDDGFVSGHATVATVVVVLLLPHVRPPVRWLLVALAVVVGVARVYVGAHLPLDVVGGAALALAVGSAVHLVLGRPGTVGPSWDSGRRVEERR